MHGFELGNSLPFFVPRQHLSIIHGGQHSAGHFWIDHIPTCKTIIRIEVTKIVSTGVSLLHFQDIII
jgi:hypothetical protein